MAGTSGTIEHRVPILDLPGSEHIRESFVVGDQQAEFQIEKDHRRVLGTLLSNSKPSDLVFYEYALETLRKTLTILTPGLAEQVRTAIARMIIAVAKASGEGLAGTGSKVSPEEKTCIDQIVETLSLAESESAKALLKDLPS